MVHISLLRKTGEKKMPDEVAWIAWKILLWLKEKREVGMKALGLMCVLSLAALFVSAVPDPYSVKWDSPSENEFGSMPVGNGELGANVWITPDGTVHFYLQRSDSWDEAGRHLKLGGFDVATRLAPDKGSFSQELSALQGTLSATWMSGGKAVKLLLFVDANRPVLSMRLSAPGAPAIKPALNNWRLFDGPRVLEKDEIQTGDPANGASVPTTVWPDTVCTNIAPFRIGSYHMNRGSDGIFNYLGQLQGVSEFKERTNPLEGRIFGFIAETWEISKGEIEINAAGVTAVPSTPELWQLQTLAALKETCGYPFETRLEQHKAWWQAFHERSFIEVSPATEAAAKETASVSQAYALQRYIIGCTGRGNWPIRFNGSIFTVAQPGTKGGADYRRWGNGYWWQNTRLPYYPMLTAGDGEMMMPLFNMYTRLTPFEKKRTQKWLGQPGAFFAECIYYWGDVFTHTYGATPYEKRTDKLQEGQWHKWAWVGTLELSGMMLDYWEYTGDDAFLTRTALPSINAYLEFFDNRYKLDGNGKYLMYPAQAIETWWDCTNPMTEIAGLRSVSAKLLALPETFGTAEERKLWTRVATRTPELPTRPSPDGKTMFAPAAKFASRHNIELPELYCVFPFHLASFEKPNAPLAIEAMKYRRQKQGVGWMQDDLFAAMLGDTAQARSYLTKRCMTNKYPGARFPAFWGPNWDWWPDQCAGGNIERALQLMLMQTEGKHIWLCPAWPKDWNCSFRLHAPYRTTVQGRVENGKVLDLIVTPVSRATDVTIVPVP
jgi:alpha-L-fucosidase 2